MRIYNAYGVYWFHLCAGYKGDLIKDYFRNYRQEEHDIEIDLANGGVSLLDHSEEVLPWNVRIQDTGEDMLAGSRIQRAMKYVSGDEFLATYGDGVVEVNMKALIESHRKSVKLATITAVRPLSTFGELGIEGDTATSFMEKPQTAAGWINGGFLVLNRAIFEALPPDQNITLEQGVLEDLASRGELNVYRHHGFWQCMDTYREMQLLEDYWRSGNAPWKIW